MIFLLVVVLAGWATWWLGEWQFGRLDERKGDIVDAIESINRLAISARTHQDSIDLALDELPSALDSLDRQRKDLVAMLQGLTRLSDVGVRVINATQTSTVNSLKALDPILTNIARAGDDFAKGFSTFLTYPFIDEAVGRDPNVARNLHMGDYVNLSIDLQLDLNKLRLPDLVCIPINELPDSPLDELINLKNLCDGATRVLQSCLRTPPDAQACLNALPKFLDDNFCRLGGINLPVLCGGLLGGARTPAPGGRSPADDLLGSVLNGGGLARPGFGGSKDAEVMWRDFDASYDIDMVDLLAAPLVAEDSGRSAR